MMECIQYAQRRYVTCYRAPRQAQEECVGDGPPALRGIHGGVHTRSAYSMLSGAGHVTMLKTLLSYLLCSPPCSLSTCPTPASGHPGKHKRNVWVVARQHPGEAMAEWFMEGFLDRLTDPHDAASMRVLEHAVFYVVSTSGSDPPLSSVMAGQ